MEQPDSKTIVPKALAAFGVSEQHSIEVEFTAETAEPSLARWSVLSNKRIRFTKDICDNADLLTFAAYCSAAYIKNNGYAKANAAFWAAICANLAFAPTSILLSYNHPYHCYIVCGTSLAALLAAGPLNLPVKIAHAVENNLATKAFAQACQKLIEEKNFKAITTYYAFARLIKHAPVDPGTQQSIIEQNLNANNYSIESIIRSNSVESRILDNSRMEEGKRVSLASSFYPPQNGIK